MYFYSFRVDIHYRAYIRIDEKKIIIFDVNNHDYEIIKKKLNKLILPF